MTDGFGEARVEPATSRYPERRVRVSWEEPAPEGSAVIRVAVMMPAAVLEALRTRCGE